MRRISCCDDLRFAGLHALTGESCGLGYRILFDATERGRSIVGRWLGIPDMRLAEPWSTGPDDDPCVGSLLISPESIVPLGVFALLDAGCTEVWLRDGELVGIEPDDNPGVVAAQRESSPPSRVLRAAGTAGDRNVHVMSGRIT